MEHLPPETNTIYVCPDGGLTALPWAALSLGDGRILLEDFAVAVVPHGQFLLAQLGGAASFAAIGGGTVLAVGDVSYEKEPKTWAPDSTLLAGTYRAAVRGEGQGMWPSLPGTRSELDAILAAAGNRRRLALRGAEAGTSRVLAELPNARWAHLATHGFFAGPRFRSVLQLDEEAFEHSSFHMGGERRTVAGRNPLVLSGLVLAGANLPQEKDEYGILQGDGGILTAEGIAALPLDGLELAVLSACETGLGDVAGGEGVFGLQRAFHLTGTRNVIASLWKVDDQATAALMKLFYHKLWNEKKPPIEALREAQLYMYRNPDQIERLAGPRALALDEPQLLPDGGRRKPGDPAADPKLWAAWVLSGPGR